MSLEFPFEDADRVGTLKSESGLRFDAYLDICNKSAGRFRLCFHDPRVHQGKWNFVF